MNDWVIMEKDGETQRVRPRGVEQFESMGWQVSGAIQGDDSVKKDAPSQKSPKTPRKKKNEND